MTRIVSSSIWYYFSDPEAEGNQQRRLSLVESVKAMEWRMQREMIQDEVHALNIYLSLHSQNPADYFKSVVQPYRNRD